MNLKEAKRLRRKKRIIEKMSRYQSRLMRARQPVPEPKRTVIPFEPNLTPSVPTVWLKPKLSLWERIKNLWPSGSKN